MPMKNKFLGESVVAFTLIILLIALVNPFHIFMPTMLEMILVAVIALFFLLFAGFIWREQVSDEREELHRFLGARFAYLGGASILIVALLVQSFTHTLDSWIVFALVGMLVAKVAGRIYAQSRY